MDQNTAWNKFMQTGAINDYVNYIKLQNSVANSTSTVEGDININADDNQRNNYSGEKYRG